MELQMTSSTHSKNDIDIKPRKLYVLAKTDAESLCFLDPDDLLVPGVYEVWVRPGLSDAMAVRCAVAGFHRTVPISDLDAFALSVIDPVTGVLSAGELDNLEEDGEEDEDDDGGEEEPIDPNNCSRVKSLNATLFGPYAEPSQTHAFGKKKVKWWHI
jgi:hypothetical protein